MDIRLVLLGLLVGAVSYLLWKLSSEEHPVKTEEHDWSQCEKINITRITEGDIPPWIDWKLSYEDLIRGLSLITGFGGAFYRALELKSFKFRELVYSLGNQKLARAWLREAISFGLVTTSFDDEGVRKYTLDSSRLRMIEELIVSALEYLRRNVAPNA